MKSADHNLKIYELLVAEFPHLFANLENVPKELEQAGKSPVFPENMIQVEVSITPENSFAEIVEQFQKLKGNIHSFSYYVDRPVLAQEPSDSGYKGLEEGPDDDTDDLNEDFDWRDYEDRNWNRDCVAQKYGDPTSIKMRAQIEDPDYNKKVRQYQHDNLNWLNRIHVVKERKAKINDVIQRNHSVIEQARKNYRDLWIQAGRKLKGGNSKEWLTIKADALRKELEMITSQLEQPSQNSGEVGSGDKILDP